MKCQNCLDLRQEWLALAASSGFEDIETDDGESIKTHKTVNLVALQDCQSIETFKAAQDYYSWARSKVNDSRFDSDKSRLIWECHSDGMARREIGPKVGYEHSWVSRKIKKIERYLKAQSVGSGSSQLDLFFWSSPWEFTG